MRGSAFNALAACLPRRGHLRIDHRAASNKIRFAVNDDKDVVGLVVHFRAALHAAVGDDDQAFVFDDTSALDRRAHV